MKIKTPWQILCRYLFTFMAVIRKKEKRKTLSQTVTCFLSVVVIIVMIVVITVVVMMNIVSIKAIDLMTMFTLTIIGGYLTTEAWLTGCYLHHQHYHYYIQLYQYSYSHHFSEKWRAKASLSLCCSYHWFVKETNRSCLFLADAKNSVINFPHISYLLLGVYLYMLWSWSLLNYLTMLS